VWWVGGTKRISINALQFLCLAAIAEVFKMLYGFGDTLFFLALYVGD
jgi:hypothetical protein